MLGCYEVLASEESVALSVCKSVGKLSVECFYCWEDLDLIHLHQAYTITPSLGTHNEISDNCIASIANKHLHQACFLPSGVNSNL